MTIAYCSNECKTNHSRIVNDFQLEVIGPQIEYISVFDKQVCIMFKNKVMASVVFTADPNKFGLHVANWVNDEYNFTYGNISNISSETCAEALQIIAKLVHNE